MKKIMPILSLFIFFNSISCNEITPIGLRFTLLNDTPVWELAKAVENEDTDLIRKLIQQKHIDVNFKEKKSECGVTVLHLAVGNDKLKSVKALLENGAKIDIRDSMGFYPVNYICNMSMKHKNRIEILRLLLKKGANPNAVAVAYRNGDTIQVVTPLGDAVQNLECTKILLEEGANMYAQVKYKPDEQFQIKYINWNCLFSRINNYPEENESIQVAKYLIVDKQMPIPDPLEYLPDPTSGQLKHYSALDFLNKADFTYSEKQKAKEEILAYLKKEGFPEHGVIRDGKVIK